MLLSFVCSPLLSRSTDWLTVYYTAAWITRGGVGMVMVMGMVMAIATRTFRPLLDLRLTLCLFSLFAYRSMFVFVGGSFLLRSHYRFCLGTNNANSRPFKDSHYISLIIRQCKKIYSEI